MPLINDNKPNLEIIFNTGLYEAECNRVTNESIAMQYIIAEHTRVTTVKLAPVLGPPR